MYEEETQRGASHHRGHLASIHPGPSLHILRSFSQRFENAAHIQNIENLIQAALSDDAVVQICSAIGVYVSAIYLLLNGTCNHLHGSKNTMTQALNVDI